MLSKQDNRLFPTLHWGYPLPLGLTAVELCVFAVYLDYHDAPLWSHLLISHLYQNTVHQVWLDRKLKYWTNQFHLNFTNHQKNEEALLLKKSPWGNILANILPSRFVTTALFTPRRCKLPIIARQRWICTNINLISKGFWIKNIRNKNKKNKKYLL